MKIKSPVKGVSLKGFALLSSPKGIADFVPINRDTIGKVRRQFSLSLQSKTLPAKREGFFVSKKSPAKQTNKIMK